jgi:hypothetical protein
MECPVLYGNINLVIEVCMLYYKRAHSIHLRHLYLLAVLKSELVHGTSILNRRSAWIAVEDAALSLRISAIGHDVKVTNVRHSKISGT